jgi:hypothetical protein
MQTAYVKTANKDAQERVSIKIEPTTKYENTVRTMSAPKTIRIRNQCKDVKTIAKHKKLVHEMKRHKCEI